MKRLFAILFALFCTMPLFCQDREVDSLLRVLDASVQGRERYTLERQSQINALQCQLKATRSDAELLEIYQELFGKYSAYRMDSALWAANRCVEVAQRMPVASHLYSARMRVAEVMIGTGMYKEGLEILEDIPQEELGAIDMFYYYNLYHKVYTLMASYAFSEELQASYSRLAYQYKDSILRVKRPDSQGYQLTLGDKLLYEGKYDEAIGVLEGCYDIHSQKDFSLAIPSVALASVYGAKGDHKQEKKYLTISAIADVQSGTKEYISLWKLANLLYGEGDIERAYTYMECSMQDATFCNARYRTMEISGMLPVINSTYEAKLHEEKEQLVTLFIWISILAAVLLVALVYIYHQMKRLSLARKTMDDMNKELKHINGDLQELNARLQESNRVKEEYIGYVFNMCSVYIDKQEEFRKMLARKVKAGQLDDLVKTIHSTTFVTGELKEFFHTFDSVFLKLYPKFVNDFNNLLQENERIYPKEGELLTPKLRVFALIRLGISDSGKIATFLHYSSQTAYNYRLKVRSKSFLSKEDFLNMVQKIG